MGYDAATFGNHEFDWGQDVLTAPHHTGRLSLRYRQHREKRRAIAPLPGGHPSLCGAPYQDPHVGTAPNTVKVAFIGVTTPETPTITIVDRHRRAVLQGSC